MHTKPDALPLIYQLALIGVIDALDFAAGRDINPWILYALPIILTSLGYGVRSGLRLCGLVAALMLANAFLLGNPFTNSTALLINLMSNVLALALVAILAALAAGRGLRLLDDAREWRQIKE